jgi:hypothetical protein
MSQEVITITAAIQAGNQGTSGVQTLFTGIDLTNKTMPLGNAVSMSSATYNLACAAAFSAAGGSLT